MEPDVQDRLKHIQDLAAGSYRRSGEVLHMMRLFLIVAGVVIVLSVGWVLTGGYSSVIAGSKSQKVALVSSKSTKTQLCASAYDHALSKRSNSDKQMLRQMNDSTYDPVTVRDEAIKACVAK